MKKKKFAAAAVLAVPAFAAFAAMPVINAAADTADVPAIEIPAYSMGSDLVEDYVGEPAAAPAARRRAFSNRSTSLPSQVDISESPYFPPIGNQMQVGSCYAWSSTYYQFTYEANRLNGIETTAENAYSPSYVYNYRTSTWGKKGHGSNCTTVYDFLKEHGALHLSEMPYHAVDGSVYIDTNNYDYSLSTNTDAMIDALHTRVSGHNAATIPGTGTPITGPQSASLNEVKQLLADGKPLIIQIDAFNWNYWYRNTINETTGQCEYYLNSDGKLEQVAYRGYRLPDDEGGHEMTVVGYDDSIWYDFNGNGIQEEAECGAFKVANSWGTTYCNDGFVWVMYDALNRESAVPGDWEEWENGTRLPVFDRSETMYVNGEQNVNAFYYMTVENKDVYYVGQLTVSADDGVGLDVYAGRNTMNENDYHEKTIHSYPYPYEKVPYEGTLAFDYGDLCSPIGDYISGYRWYIRLSNYFNTASFRITDEFSNTIADFGALDSAHLKKNRPINLVMGDLNYDGRFTQDDLDIYNSGVELSALQQYLATNILELTLPDDSDLTATTEVVASWAGGQIVSVTVRNNGTEPVNSWALHTNSFEGTVVSIWGANLLSNNDVQCAGYNAVIPAGGEVTFGYQLANPTGIPAVFTPITARADVTENATVLFDASNSWGEGFIGFITIQNNSDEAMTAWELTFTAEGFTIVDAGALNVVTNTDGSYTVSGANENFVIPAHSSLTFQFVGAQTGTPSISVILLTAADI